MGTRAAGNANTGNQQLSDRELMLIAGTSSEQLARLRPFASDPPALDALLTAVQESTRRNEDLAGFRRRIEDLGSGVYKAAREILPALRTLQA